MSAIVSAPSVRSGALTLPSAFGWRTLAQASAAVAAVLLLGTAIFLSTAGVLILGVLPNLLVQYAPSSTLVAGP